MNILMVGVGKNRLGGMLTVANEYINSEIYNKNNKLYYVATSKNGNVLAKVLCMITGYIKVLFLLFFFKIDIVHIHMAEKGSTFRKGLIAKWAKKNNKKVVIHMHAGPFMNFYNSLNNKKKEKVRKILNNYSDKILVLGNFWLEKLEEIVPKQKMAILYNGVPIPQKNNYNIDAKDIVYFGVINERKGFYDILKAIKKIDNKLDKDIKVKLYGKDMIGNIEEIIKKEKLENRIEFKGWIESEEKEKALKKAIISILPSYFEALSMTIIEAMSYGIPVITTNISTMEEILNSNEFLFEPGDTDKFAKLLLKLINNKELRKKISELEYKRVKKTFSEETMMKKTLEIYKELID